MNSKISCGLLLFWLCILFIGAPRLIDAKPRNVIWSMISAAKEIPPESLIPHRRVKRIRRDAFDGIQDQGPEFQNTSDRVKEYFPVWNDADGEPKAD